ncbi:MAG TPA: hypothetical protein VFP31_04270 [Gaiellaceae bacterium]|nr:hypothetical protein [Gaiellaceae bacterium]
MIGGAVVVLATVGLMRGLWPAWAFLTVVAVGDLVYALGTGTKWWGTVVLNVVMLSLLLAPTTRRYVRHGRPRFAG